MSRLELERRSSQVLQGSPACPASANRSPGKHATAPLGQPGSQPFLFWASPKLPLAFCPRSFAQTHVGKKRTIAAGSGDLGRHRFCERNRPNTTVHQCRVQLAASPHLHQSTPAFLQMAVHSAVEYAGNTVRWSKVEAQNVPPVRGCSAAHSTGMAGRLIWRMCMGVCGWRADDHRTFWAHRPNNNDDVLLCRAGGCAPPASVWVSLRWLELIVPR